MVTAPHLSAWSACQIVFAQLLLAVLCGCTQPDADKPLIPVRDDLQREVRVPVSPDRVLSLAPSLTEIIYAAGAGHKVVGVTTADDYPAVVLSLPRFSALPVNFEAVAALEPDLILASDQINSPQDAATLAAIGLPVYFVGVRTLDDMLKSIRTVGYLLGTSPAANRTADSLEASLAALADRTAAVQIRPSTLFLVGDATLYAFGKGSYMHSMIALAGGKSVTRDHNMASPVLTDEYVLTRKPEVIIGSFGMDHSSETLLEHHRTWDLVPAIVQGRVYSVPGDYFLRPGPRLVTGAWMLVALLHPDLVPSP